MAARSNLFNAPSSQLQNARAKVPDRLRLSSKFGESYARSATETKPAPTMAPAPVRARSRFLVWLMAVLLVVVTIASTGRRRPWLRHYDDDLQVTSNLHVQSGLTLESMKWHCSAQ